MNKFLTLIFAALLSVGCGGAAQQTSPTANANQIVQNPANAPIAPTRSADLEKLGQQTPSNKTASIESPMAKPIDVSAMTAEIEKAQKNPSEKEALAKAYFTRAFALTEAAQYRAALGDFRKGLKLNPNDADAKAMHDQIIGIFKSINREPPKEGEEPAPMALK